MSRGVLSANEKEGKVHRMKIYFEQVPLKWTSKEQNER